MRRGRRRYTAALLLAGTLLIPGCQGCVPPSRTEFIETLASDNRDLSRAAQNFRRTLLPLKDGKPADPGQVHQAYQAAEKTLQDVKARANSQPLPVSSKTAKDFLSAYKDYLDGQQKILENFMQRMVSKVDEPDTPIADKWAFIDGLLQGIQAEENKTWTPLTAAEQAYTDENNFQAQSLKMWLDAKKAGK